MKIKAPFTFEPWSKVIKAWGRQCNRHFYIWDAAGKRCAILTFWAAGYRSLYDGTKWICGWYARQVHEKGYLRDKL